MKFNRDGFLFRVVYGWKNKSDTPEKKHQTNICSLFWATVFAVLLAWPFIIITSIFWWVVRIVGAIPAMVLFGYKPTGYSWKSHPLSFVPIEWWPKVTIYEKKWHVMPIVLILVLVTFLIGSFVVIVVVFVLRYVIVSSVLVMILIIIIMKAPNPKKTEVWRMVTSFVKAKKEKVCPIVTF